MNFADGQLLFETLAAKRGVSSIREGAVAMVSRENACLRLRPTVDGICLEISHGPPDGAILGWLDLYSDPENLTSPSFEDCVAYGLDLLGVYER